MKKIAYKVIHKDIGNTLRNYSYAQISEAMLGFEEIASETTFLKTREECISFLKKNPSLKVNIIKDYTGENTIFPPRSGVIGIIGSNYLAWKEFLKTDNDILVLFEDDITVSKNIKYFINRYIDELPEDWDVFSFYIPDDIKHLYNPSLNDIDGKEFICKSYTTHCCAAYMMNRKSVQKAIDDIEKNGISAPIDWYVLNVKHLGNEPTIFNVYCLKPGSYLPSKEIPEEYFSSIAHYGKTEEFNVNERLDYDTI